MCLLAQLGEAERLNDILKLGLRILIEHPHGLCSINRAASADGNDPVRTEFLHRLCAPHDRLDRRIRLNALKELYLETSALQILLHILEEAAATHAMAARDNNCLVTLEIFNLMTRTLAEVQVTRIRKPTHEAPLLLAA